MANRKRKVSRREKGFEAKVEVDDSLLPAAEELLKLKEVDPSLIPFLKERISLEQDRRWNAHDNIMDLNKSEQKLTHGLNYIAIIAGFILTFISMFGSYHLIMAGHTIIGSIFGGVGMCYVLYLFISVVNRSAKPPQAK